MKRYIDAEKVICDLENAIIDNSIHPETFTFFAVKEFIKLLKSEPTVDVVEVVRCKYCKHFCYIENDRGKCLRHVVFMKITDFCNCGAKMNGQ